MATGKHAGKVRLDQLLVQRGLVETREKARAVIMAGLVEVAGMRVDKPGRLLPADAAPVLRPGGSRYVSRGGTKLEAALNHFGVDLRSQTILDVGASTGGFTDCLLQHGARRVIAVDVGYGQLDWRLRRDARVHVLEKTNIRHLKPEELNEPVAGAVIDVSFISLAQVLPPVSELLPPEAFVIGLIKPQFEVGKGQVGKGGVVRDPALHRAVVEKVEALARGLSWTVVGHTPSPLLGPKGNREFLLFLTRRAHSGPAPGEKTFSGA